MACTGLCVLGETFSGGPPALPQAVVFPEQILAVYRPEVDTGRLCYDFRLLQEVAIHHWHKMCIRLVKSACLIPSPNLCTNQRALKVAEPYG